MKMATWAYIATTAGAPMSKTLALAEGTALKRFKETPVPGETPGLIHRSHYSGGKETPRIKELKVGHEIVLMYDFMDTGLVYPLARFKILDPNENANQYSLKQMGLDPQSYKDLDTLIELQQGERLQPDYIGNVDKGPNNDPQPGRHLALIVQQISAGPPINAIGKIFRRDPTVTHNTILPWEEVENELVKEYDAEFKDTEERKEQLLSLVPKDINIRLGTILEPLWHKSLDGRSKQLLINAKHLQSARTESIYDNDFRNSTLSGYCLIALVEYEMLRLLKKRADINLLLSGNDMWNFRALRLYTGNERFPAFTHLPLAPEGVDDNCSFNQQMHAIPFIARGPRRQELIASLSNDMEIEAWVKKWKQAIYPMLRARNRIAHSFYLQKVHFDELWKLVCREDGILKLLHG
jgi:hypothetical protein